MTTTTNVPRCLVAILAAPLALMVVAVRLGFLVIPVPARVKAILRRFIRKVYVRQGLRERRRLRSSGRLLYVDGDEDVGPFLVRATDVWEGTGLTEPRRTPKEEYVAFLHAVKSMVGPILLLVLCWLIWKDLGKDFMEEFTEAWAETWAVLLGGIEPAAPVARATSAALGTRTTLCVVAGFIVHCFDEPNQRSFVISAAGLSMMMAWYAHAVIEMFAKPSTEQDWVIRRGYVHAGPSPSSVATGANSTSNDDTCATTTLDHIDSLCKVAVSVDRACMLLFLLLTAAALNRLLSITESVRSLMESSIRQLHGPSTKHAPLVRVHHTACRFIMCQQADEYRCTLQDLSDPNELQETTRQMFQLLSHNGSCWSSDVAVWFGDLLCVRNSRPSTHGGIGLDRVGTVSIPGALPYLYLYGTAAAATASAKEKQDHHGALAVAMDTVFHLLAMYDGICCPTGDRVLKIARDGSSFVGSFPVSQRGLSALVRYDPYAINPRRRSYHLHELGLSADQWDCIFRSSEGPEEQLCLSGLASIEFPEAVGGLISALQANSCLAGIFVIDLPLFPPAVLHDILEALERNRSVTELAVSVGFLGIGDDDAVYETALLGLVGCLARRQHCVDVLELHVSKFSDRAWKILWTEVVPSRALNVRRLVLHTGPDPGVDEELMVRAVCSSANLCELHYENKAHAVGVVDRVRPSLTFTRLRRLISEIEKDPSAFRRSRWFGTILIRSAATPSRQPNPAWCYHLLRWNAGSLPEDLKDAGRANRGSGRALASALNLR
jgi:hypothetical protein